MILRPPRYTRTDTRFPYPTLFRSNQAALMRGGPFYPDHGLERIVDYHERQDARFAQAAADASERYDKPVLTATELAVTHPDNAGPAAVRATGRLCYPSANRAVARSEEHTSEPQSLMRNSYAV